MSRLVLGISLLVLAAPASAQNAAAWRDSAYRLSAERQRVWDSLKQDDSRLEEISRRAGLVVSATTEYRAFAEEVLDRFDAARRRWFGAALPGPAGFRITLRHGESWSFGRQTSRPQALSIAGLPDTGDARLAPFVPDANLGSPEKAAQQFLGEYGNLMMASAPTAIRGWLQAGLLLDLGEDSRKERAMYSLVTGVGKAQRECVRGDARACAHALGVRRSEDPDAGGEYYPLVRSDLLLAALEQGGEGAWTRLMAADGTVEQGLAAAAGIPADSMLLRWRAGLLDLQPDRGPLDRSAAGLILGWSALILAAGLGIARWV
ncbi:MAG TPA: hypothetical protein VLB00_04400 [Gemmatimonadales bacterium]|nr:hypothetical protein [Gemmatimonadales bacterium]